MSQIEALILGAVIMGAICAFFVVRALISEMNTIKGASDADHYVAENSFRIFNRRDHYLRTSVTSTPLPKKNN